MTRFRRTRALLQTLGALLFVSALAGTVEGATVAAGSSHTVVIRTTDQTVWTWGLNSSGQLGLGNTTQQKSPVQVTSISGIVAVASGANFTMALKSDGVLYAWGQNNNGQVGNGNTTNQTSPVQVLTGVTAIAAGDNHAVALKANGSLWTWGHNGFGQLGDGGTSNRSNPGEVTGVGTISVIGAGANHTMAVVNAGYANSRGSSRTPSNKLDSPTTPSEDGSKRSQLPRQPAIRMIGTISYERSAEQQMLDICMDLGSTSP